jgi:hypothetical protein
MPQPDARVAWAGVRISSHSLESNPKPQQWAKAIAAMESWYSGSVGAAVLIVGNLRRQGQDLNCWLSFPLEKPLDGVKGAKVDSNAAFLDWCDQQGYAIWLQVEPGNADLPDLAELVMRRYGHHPAVRGFGLDVEWHRPSGTSGFGTPITDALAQDIVQRVRGVNPRFSVFLKHWDADWLPDKQREGLIFISDSQFHETLETMSLEFKDWAKHFYPSPVIFQIGYESDQELWSTYQHPALELGLHLTEDIAQDQICGIMWVDHTLQLTFAAQGIILE